MGRKRKQTVTKMKQSVKMPNNILKYSIEYDRKKHLIKIMSCTERQEIILGKKDVLIFIKSLLECVTKY